MYLSRHHLYIFTILKYSNQDGIQIEILTKPESFALERFDTITSLSL